MLPFWALVDLLLIGVCAAAGVREALRLGRRDRDLDLDSLPDRARYLTPLLAAGAVLLVILFLVILLRTRKPFLFWFLPAPVEQYLFPVLGWALLGVLSFTSGLTGMVAAKGLHPRRWLAVASAILLVITVAVARFSAGRPITADLGAPAYSGFMAYQTSGPSGAAASGATVARALGQARTEGDMVRLFGTSRMGTSSAQVVTGMARIGVKARKVRQHERDIRKVRPPAILILDSLYGGAETQAGAFLGFSGGRARVWDPMDGLVELEPEGLARIWRGKAIECALETTRPKSKTQNPR